MLTAKAQPLVTPARGSSIGAPPRAKASPRVLESRLAMMLTGGGDERLWLDGVTRRNKYGVPAMPAPDEVWLSSSTASAISPRGWVAAGAALDRTLSSGASRRTLQDDVRAQLAAIYGVPGCEVVLAGSGTETELLLVALAAGDGSRPLTNILTAPLETGRGVPAAAAGCHFLSQTPLGQPARPGERLPSWESLTLHVETIDIRKAGGALRNPEKVDHEAYERADRAVARGDRVILHVLDSSKTGRGGVSRSVAQLIAETFGDEVLIVVDACQLRCSVQTIRDDLANGRAVMITGSKFAGGPSFSGALLVPPAMARRTAKASPFVQGLGGYSSAADWPRTLGISPGAGLANLGLGLRWTAALAEIQAYNRADGALKTWFRDSFDAAVTAAVDARPWLRRLDEGHAGDEGNLIPVFDEAGGIKALHDALRQPGPDGAFHLGQPVMVGAEEALRICSSMPMISGFAERVAAGATPPDAFSPVAADLVRLFDRWDLARAI